jgi:glycosyltransferase involved in cell wall biosynthesis
MLQRMDHSLQAPAAGPLGRLSGLSIVLPCKDEAGNVERAIDEATHAAQRVADAHEILIVDDGSRDATWALAAARASDDPRIRVVVHPRNRGYGAALRTGFAAARMEWVFVTDADLQFDLDDLDCVLALAPACDLVAGYRLQRADRLHRRLNAAAWNALVRRSFDLPVRDVDCAFKLIHRDVLERILLTADGAMVSTELIVRAQAAGAEIAELGVTHRPRTAGRSSGAHPAVVLRAFRELRALRAQVRAEADGPAVRPATRARAV